MSAYSGSTLQTIKQIPETGKFVVPDCRMKDAAATQYWVRRLKDNDCKRAWKRSRTNGLVDGNPPYNRAKLLAANRAEAANINWGIARSYMESGSGAFYDLTNEAPGLVGIRTSHGTDEQREIWSSVMSSEADKILKEDPTWDYEVQQSQNNMVMHGCGPLMFEDCYKCLPRAFLCGDLLVPEFTKSDTKYWDGGVIMATYYTPELYKFILNEKAASDMGWNVEFTKLVISQAMDIKTRDGRLYNWEWYQQELKNNSLSYYDDTKVCWLAHVFWREFDGRITHAIIQQDTQTTTPIEYLYLKVGRYASWQEMIHPMYYDRGNGGYHHSVTGLGVKMYGPMEGQNRLLCNLFDKAFSPNILFKPTTTEASQKFQMQNFGDFAVLNSNWDWQQTGVAGLMNDGMAMNNEIDSVMQQTLSSYRQQIPSKQGNPVTARQIMMEASQMSSLSKTTYNRYYKQWDLLMTEVVRRLCNINSPDEMAMDFQERCQELGVPKECFGRVESVEAIRVVGQGNAFMRKDAVQSVGQIVGRLPETGQQNWVNDYIASSAGQAAVSRYNPPARRSKMASDQNAEAMQWVAAMKVGVSPVITPTQDAAIYATTFLSAASQAMATLGQGGNPMEVLQFVSIAGPAIAGQIQRIQGDTTRVPMVKMLEKQWKQLAMLTDKLKQQVGVMQKGQQMQQQKSDQVLSDAQITQAKLEMDINTKGAKTRAQLQQSQEKHQQKMLQAKQNMELQDAKTATEIQLSKSRAAAEHQNKNGGE